MLSGMLAPDKPSRSSSLMVEGIMIDFALSDQQRAIATIPALPAGLRPRPSLFVAHRTEQGEDA